MLHLSGRLQLLQDDRGLSAGSGGQPKGCQNRKKRDQIAGEEHGDQPGSDADPEDAGHGIDPALGKKDRFGPTSAGGPPESRRGWKPRWQST